MLNNAWFDNDSVLNTIISNKPIVFVLKGFPVSELLKLNSFLPHVDNLSCITKDKKIDLIFIENNFWNLGTKINLVNASKSFILYEEFILFPTHTLPQIPVSFFVITNNFYDFYPNQSNISYPDIEDSINTEISIPDNPTFQKFYSDSRIIADINCIQYIDFEPELTSVGIKHYKFFNTNNINLPNVSNDTFKSDSTIQFQSSDASYLQLKYSLFLGNVISEIHLLVDENIKNIPADLEELKILIYLLNKNNCNLILHDKKTDYQDKWRNELSVLLKKHWGNNAEFKQLKIYRDPDTSKDVINVSQGTIVEHIIEQSELSKSNLLFEDVFLTAPTGAGKSLLFQLPAIYLSELHSSHPVTIVISPLKALMADQVIALKENRKYQKVAFLNSDLTLIEREKIIRETQSGDIGIIYMSPELLLSYDIRYFIGDRDIGLLVIDEAHLVTTWGRDFRVDYWFLGNYIRKLRRGSSRQGISNNKIKTYRFPVVAVTATAVYSGEDDMVFECISSLNMQNCRIYIGRIKREEITFKYNLFTTSSHDIDKIRKTKDRIVEFIKAQKKSIFYFPWINQIDQYIFPLLEDEIRPYVSRYHAKLGADERNETLSSFKSGKSKCVLATKAFGMGVDISDIENVYHHAPSGGLSDYVQEIGRVARIPGMKGNAIIDFNPKDLKYSKILFGLSSLKQYQVKLVLQKLSSLYLIKKNRNMLVSIEDFEYIFNKDDNTEQKVKSALLVIEKDLLAKYGYNVVIVRPKSLFSVVYCSINKDMYELINSRYGEHIKIIDRSKTEEYVFNNKRGRTIKRKFDNNVLFLRIELDKLWEIHFADDSFPSVKYKFFNKQLIPEVEPLLQIRVYFSDSVNIIFNKFEDSMKIIEESMLPFLGRYFSKEELIKNLRIKIKSETVCRKIADLLTVFFADINPFLRNSTKSPVGNNFLQIERKDGDYQYKIINTAYGKIKSQMKQTFMLEFSNVNSADNSYLGYIKSQSPSAREVLKLIYLLEIFNFATFEINGGEQPQLFIRVNDPQKIFSLSRRNYSNDVVKDVERRHGVAVDIMNYFFQNDLSDIDRWEYIEDYFLGKPIKK
jgi:superfamily II DNA helicase RecQ